MAFPESTAVPGWPALIPPAPATLPLEVVSARLGHVNPTVTLNVYRHLLEREHTDYGMGAAEAAGVELGNDEGGAPAA